MEKLSEEEQQMVQLIDNPDAVPAYVTIKKIFGPLKIDCAHDFKIVDIALSSRAIAILEYTVSQQKNSKYNQLDLESPSLERSGSSPESQGVRPPALARQP